MTVEELLEGSAHQEKLTAKGKIMVAPSTTDQWIGGLTQQLYALSLLYWKNLRDQPALGEIKVRWDADVTTRGGLPELERTLLGCLKQFEGCFIEHRGLDIQNVLVFEGIATKMNIAYRRSILLNSDLNTDLPLRHCKFGFEMNKVLITFENREYLPTMSIVALVG